MCVPLVPLPPWHLDALLPTLCMPPVGSNVNMARNSTHEYVLAVAILALPLLLSSPVRRRAGGGEVMSIPQVMSHSSHMLFFAYKQTAGSTLIVLSALSKCAKKDQLVSQPRLGQVVVGGTIQEVQT